MFHQKLSKIVIFVSFFLSIAFSGIFSHSAYAEELAVGSLGTIAYKEVDRVQVLKQFFRKYNSPLENNAETFVRVADTYTIDYRILPAISCVESTCARFYIPASYNPFGWGGGQIYFASFDDAIEKVGKGLNDIYFSKGRTTVEKIAPVYCPPNYVNWGHNVNSFMKQMDEYTKEAENS